ncbi:MAG: MFS transporter [Nanoarchaeota archaeon]|nr:MFS transporter [Nanoarchaeota archaeon]
MRKELKLLLLINSFFVFAINLFAPFYAVYVQKIDAAVLHIGGIWSFFLLSVGLLTFFISRFENHKEHADYFLIAGFMCRALGWLSYIFADSLWQLYAIQLLMALGEALGTPAYNLIYSSYLTKGEYATDWGASSALSSIITAGAAFTGGIIITTLGFSWLFGMMIALSLVSMGIAIGYKDSFR